MGLSAGSHGRILRVARTIADLDGAEEIGVEHIAGAIRYRSFDFTDFTSNRCVPLMDCRYFHSAVVMK